ncbi:hypothetical protein RQM65_09855 [Pricia sp. S334]|uniref:Tetratricopeptide repeat protein n=1 Tax=Pricia mediterranea TaxID=3076079 RepID=A0ABU3L5F8_9FLAO|nr:hypothetical protein [Pricia sp. S334]MDT7828965.1 hypothetical protein [Pricia sp. S334]
MTIKITSVILLSAFGMSASPLYAQEKPVEDPDSEVVPEVENSAAVFLEDYSDAFQENFFEGLKQKGIENYDRATHFFLKCKQLDASNRVVDHELAKMYLKTKQYPLAEEYALSAVTSAPENLWFTETLVRILATQGKSVEQIKNDLPFGSSEFKKNLAQIYFDRGRYEIALSILKETKHSPFISNLTSKINDSIAKQNVPTIKSPDALDNFESASNPLKDFKLKMQELMETDDFQQLQQISDEALESYPAQAYFYFAQGYALNRADQHQRAVETLEAGLDYLIDDASLENKIFQELVLGYTALDNAVKANMYLRKIKPGF